MAERCLCCGTKLGFLSGSRLDNTVCDSCYFKFSGHLAEMKKAKTVNEVNSCYNYTIKVAKDCNFLTEGETKVIEYIDEFKEKVCSELRQEDERKSKEVKAKSEYWDNLSHMLFSTGYNFEGYKIVEYCDIVSAETVLGTGMFSELSLAVNDFLGTSSNAYQSKLANAKKDAQDKLKVVAASCGANAVIGIDFDILTLGNNAIVVSANGTAVKIEKVVE